MDVRDITSVGLVNMVVATGLALNDGTTYYVTLTGNEVLFVLYPILDVEGFFMYLTNLNFTTELNRWGYKRKQIQPFFVLLFIMVNKWIAIPLNNVTCEQ